MKPISSALEDTAIPRSSCSIVTAGDPPDALENPNLQSGQVQIFFDERQENPEGK